ncbi:M20 family metallopeptidase [Nostocoides australiense]
MSCTVDGDGNLGDRACALLRELVAIDSVNPGLVPGAAGEAEIIAALAKRLSASGFRVEIIGAAEPGRPSLVAWPGGVAPSTPMPVLNGHVDTVGVDGMAAPFTPRIEGDRLLGRGACDMLGGVAGMVVAAEDAASGGIPVALALVADEEDRSLGTEAVLAALPRLAWQPALCLVGEPTWLAPAASLRGYAVADVTFTGRASHTSLAREGVNALTHLAAVVMAAEEYAVGVRDRGGELLASVATAGRAPFTVPDRADLTIERRTVPGEGLDVISSDVEQILARVRGSYPDLDANIAVRITRPPWRLQSHGPARDFAERLEAELVAAGTGSHTAFDAPYWMEAALWEAAGIPSLVCGPAGGGLHAVDEWLDLGQLRAYTTALAATLAATALAI